MSTLANLSRNSILKGLARDPRFRSLEDKFTSRHMETHHTVQEADKPMRSVYFPLSGMISTVVEMSNGDTVEICCVGCHGMVNWETLLGARKSRFRHFLQLPGEVASIP